MAHKRLSKQNFKDISPDNTIFAFDLHDVVVHPHIFEMLRVLFCTWEGWLFFFVVLLHPLICISVILWLIYRGKPLVIEEIWFYLVKRHPKLHSATPFFTKLANTFILDPATSLVIHRLKKRDFKVFLFSNIGGIFWRDMVIRHKELFERNFDGFCVASEDEEYLSKPNPLAYTNFLKKHNPANMKVFFIDDKLSNIEAGSKSSEHFHGYVFQSGEKLFQDLKEWGVID